MKVHAAIAISFLALIAGSGGSSLSNAPGSFLSDFNPTFARLEEVQRAANQCSSGEGWRDGILIWWETWSLDQSCGAQPDDWRCLRTRPAFENALRSVPKTRCESRLNHLSSELFERDLEALYREELPEKIWPVVGSLRTGQANLVAMQFDMPAGRLILVDPNLRVFHREIVRLVLDLIAMNAGSDGVELKLDPLRLVDQLSAHPERLEYFKWLISSAATGKPLPQGLGTATLPKRSDDDAERTAIHAELVDMLSDEGINFLIAHEYAHSFLGHQVLDLAEFLRAPTGRQNVEQFSNQFRNELFADDVGFKMWIRVLSKHRYRSGTAAIVSVAPEIMMVSLRLIELERARLGVVGTGSHPPVQVRRWRLRERMKILGLPDGTEFYSVSFLVAAITMWTKVNGLSMEDMERIVKES